jgi:hypothetical protein
LIKIKVRKEKERNKDTRIQGYKDTRIQGYKDTRIQGYKDTKKQETRNKEIRK